MGEGEKTSGQLPRKETPSAERIEAALKAAEGLPRAYLEEGEPSVEMFGNNFSLLFNELRLRDLGRTVRVSKLKRAEALGEPWRRFVSENEELIARIKNVLEEKERYSELFGIYMEFFNVGDVDGAKSFSNKVDSRLGIQAVYNGAWMKLNPLLEQAAAQMERVGIDPTQFYG